MNIQNELQKIHTQYGTSEMEDFEIIYEKDKVWGDYLKCKHCGERVERGIVSVSHHWIHCLKRTNGLIVAKNSFEKQILDSWSINK